MYLINRELTGMILHKEIIHKADLFSLENITGLELLFQALHPLQCQWTVVGKGNCIIPQRQANLVITLIQSSLLLHQWKKLLVFYRQGFFIWEKLVVTKIHIKIPLHLILQAINWNSRYLVITEANSHSSQWAFHTPPQQSANGISTVREWGAHSPFWRVHSSRSEDQRKTRWL